MMRTILLLLIAAIGAGCAQDTQRQPERSIPSTVEAARPDMVQRLEATHKLSEFTSHPAVQFDLVLNFGGKERFNGKVSMTTNSSAVRLDDQAGNTVLFDGKEVYFQSPDSSVSPRKARFDVFTWSYFFAMPYKLSDPGTNWENLADDSIMGEPVQVGKLTFGENVGDAPDDWYRIFEDPSTNLMKAAAYIVTFGGNQEEAEADPHAISYDAYQEVDGIPLAHEWAFWSWRAGEGLTEQLGDAKLSNFQFFEPEATFFQAQAGMTEAPAP
ncbi:DUF6503 family protein [Pontibacter sp. G13]|uniref:DUF6503 family protein n=1 Tax=Pontibacter sp. G13 TaxID=3074898 RepID=UPI00288A1F88|nr:DUF6503 family protein [Pontibacter sp. G13]WNJ17317.1 hypothetical protein RJD25_20905 [Pontibacter sp. G13]